MRYRIKAGSHSRHEADGVLHTYDVGDVIDMDETEAATHAARIELLAAAELPGVADPLPIRDWEEVLAGGVQFAIDTAKELESIEDLRSLLTAEREGKNRRGVTNAIEAMIEKSEEG